MDSNRDKKNHYQNVGVSYAPVSTASEDGLVTVRDPHPNSEHPNSGNNSTSAVVDMPHRTQQKPSRWNWKESSGLEKFLIVALICFLSIAVLTVVLVIALPRQSQSQASICMTADCIRTSARIIEAMDRTVDPCDDFFEYACGTWNRVNIIPDDRSTYNTFRKLGDELQVTLKALFEKPVTPSDTLSSRKVKYLFQSCINTSLIEERQDRPLKTLLEWLGGWPVLDPDWESKNTYDLELLLSRLRLLSNRVLMNIWVGADDKNSDVNIILLDQTQLGMPSRDYYLKGRTDRTLQTYQDFAISVAIALGADETRARKEIVEMVDFEITLANITIAEEFRRDTESMYARYKVSELYTNLTKEFDWLKFLNLVFANVSIQLNDSEEVIVYSSRYMVELGKLLQITPKRTLINYVIWSIVLNRVTNLHQKILDLRRPFNKVLHGTDQEQARWRGCTNYVNENLGMAVGRLFVTKHFDNKAKANAMDMIQNIRDAFKELLDDVKWMDDDTKEVAREKANAIQEKIGYPDYIMNDTALDLEHEGLKIDPNTYFENVLSNLNAASRNMFKNLRLPVDKSRWATAPAVVNAFYSATKNQIMFPAGILQPPFYHNNYPKSMNFGGIAMVIGHELTHGFDDRGRQYDKNGNMKQWWSDSVIDRFKEKAQCIIDQYSNYTVKEANMNLNGKQTQGENIADNGGLKQAFRAYKRWVERTNQDEPLLPGLNLTHEQLFFLNFAQIWCGTARPESYVQSIRVGRHSPGRFRVIGVLSNSEEFTEAFKCPPGSKMNPANKCSVW